MAVNCRGELPELMRNDGGNVNHWIEVLLISTKSNRDGTGAALKLTTESSVLVDQAKGGTSYMSASDPRIHFGLGKRSKIDSLVITWPSGQVDRLSPVFQSIGSSPLKRALESCLIHSEGHPPMNEIRITMTCDCRYFRVFSDRGICPYNRPIL